MKKVKRIAALIGVVFLLSLYALTFIASFTSSSHSMALFQASLYSTIFIPIMIYVYIFIYKLIKKYNQDNIPKDNENQN
jgi:hypothetical protein